jgi:hypothetical protein
MERRHFLKLSLGFAAGAAGAAALAASAQAAPLPLAMPAAGFAPPVGQGAEAVAEPAVASQDDVDRLAPEQVRYGRRRRRFARRIFRVRRRFRRFRF